MHPSDNIFDPHQLFSGLIWESVISHSGVNLPTPALTNYSLAEMDSRTCSKTPHDIQNTCSQARSQTQFWGGIFGAKTFVRQLLSLICISNMVFVRLFVGGGNLGAQLYRSRPDETRHRTAPYRTVPKNIRRRN